MCSDPSFSDEFGRSGHQDPLALESDGDRTEDCSTGPAPSPISSTVPLKNEKSQRCVSPSRFRRRETNPIRSILSLKAIGHEEHKGHTLYVIACFLRMDGAQSDDTSGQNAIIEWTCKLRLCELRKSLHAWTKAHLGQVCYENSFLETPFARRGGLPGTICRISRWLETLAACVNSGIFDTASVIELILRHLQAPLPEDGDEKLRLLFEQVPSAGLCKVCSLPSETALKDAGGRLDIRGMCARCGALRDDAVDVLKALRR